MTQGRKGIRASMSATASIRRYPARSTCSTRKSDRRSARSAEAVKAELEDKIKPRPTFAQRQEKLEKKAKREAKEAKRERAVAERLRALHDGDARRRGGAAGLRAALPRACCRAFSSRSTSR